jgi:hypothetical protein
MRRREASSNDVHIEELASPSSVEGEAPSALRLRSVAVWLAVRGATAVMLSGVGRECRDLSTQVSIKEDG